MEKDGRGLQEAERREKDNIKDTEDVEWLRGRLWKGQKKATLS